jgi:glycosyltransferase involved in cell wall biosynthesis
MIKDDIKVSVIIPIYNAYDYLRPALDTVVDQTLREIEIICIDDGSTDRSLDIIKEYQKADERVRIVTENNAGVSTARNKGIIRTRGKYIIFLDADDFYEPTLLEDMYEMAERESLDITVSLYDIYNNKTARFSPPIEEDHGDIYAQGNVTSKNEFPNFILQSVSGYVWNKLFRAEFIKDKELTFAPELYVFEDIHFVCTALSLANRVGRVEKTLVHHRVYSNQFRAKFFKKYYPQIPVVYMKIKEFLMQHGMYIPLAQSYLNLSASRCYKIYNLLWKDAKADFWNMLHEGYADRFGWFQQEASDFELGEVCDFVANVGLYTHDQYMKRVAAGRRLKTENMTSSSLKKRISTKRDIQKFTNPFRRLFKRSEKHNGEEK